MLILNRNLTSIISSKFNKGIQESHRGFPFSMAVKTSINITMY